MALQARVWVREGPPSKDDLTEIEERRTSDLARMRRLEREVRRMWIQRGVVVALFVVAAWCSVFLGATDLWTVLVLTCMVVIGLGAFAAIDLRHQDGRTEEVSAHWTDLIAHVQAHGVRSATLHPIRALQLGDENWFVDVGDGWWVWLPFGDFDTPDTLHATTRFLEVAPGMVIAAMAGDEVSSTTSEARPWHELPESHPIRHVRPPVAFRGGDDPVKAFPSFPQGHALFTGRAPAA